MCTVYIKQLNSQDQRTSKNSTVVGRDGYRSYLAAIPSRQGKGGVGDGEGEELSETFIQMHHPEIHL